ncbi:hypothetical protein EHQ27_11840 [Leptospira wolffii]|uniref:hypothetical protein n=1 Tax=Leptospira wolffii TaxID=409998 RepID=UPI001082F3C8|nr:hypothetical protein [Leptospira wolffii]TGK62398.1 hypothetical protein EHQ32_06130 [Leptospira wolffii]TGK70662.1 hypothetical protein EHQ27_11840 [Leptospira wolffii]TGK74218.1 hypothetical protein EHQ35_07645 [Leptospira wolffii]TGL32207.1 hypothetical protein EHQ57_05030 [Leptospira wolffii]
MIGLPLRTDPVGSIRNLLFRLKSIPGIEIWAAIGLLLVVSYWNAWLSDDAFISFRVVDNFVNGYGLRWNIDERVQVFTNPLLVLLLILPYSLWQNIVVISLIVSFLSCLGTILLLRKISSNGVAFLLAIGFLLSSKAFVDYLYSGLENSLNYFIQTFFFYIYWTKRDGSNDSRFPLLVLIASVGFVSRMDFVLIFVLPLFFRFYTDVKSGKWDKTSLGKVLLAGSPALLWLLFAAFYYGSFLPNTYYAKTNVVDSFRSIIAQGFAYYRFQFVWDPISFASIPLLILLRISFGRNIGPFREGVLYSIPYSLYILSVGGDFMAGRFFGYIILLFGLSIARMDSFEWKEKVFAFAFLIIYSFAFSDSPIRMPDEDTISAKRVIGKEGITDERLYYYNLTSLISRGASSSLLIPLAEKRQILPPEKRVFVTRNIGFVGFLMGPKYHIVDFYALSDPLLSRIFGFGRIGHKIRAIPAGYLDSIESGKNQLSSSDLREYYEGIRVLTQADIFDSRRWDLFWNFQFGRQRRFYNVYQIDDKVVAKSIHDYFH